MVIYKKGRLGAIALLLFLMNLFVACDTSDNKKIEGKWQLRRLETADTIIQKVDSVFYNFQKGSFSANCLLFNGGYESFFGNYILQDNKISINLLPEYQGYIYDKYIGWKDWQRTFMINDVSSTSLLLQYADTIYVFRRY